MKKKYSKPEINLVSLDKDIVMFMVSDPNQYQHQHRHGHGHNVQGDNVRENAFGGSSPFPDSPQY